MDLDDNAGERAEAPNVLDPALQREVDRAKRDIKLVGVLSIGLIGLMIVFTIVAVLLAYGD